MGKNLFNQLAGEKKPKEFYATQRMEKKLVKQPFFKKHKGIRPFTGPLSVLINFASLGSASFGAYTLLNTANSGAYLVLGICLFVLACLEYASWKLSDSYWDSVFLYGEKFSAKFLVWALVFSVGATVSCMGIYRANSYSSAPDPYYEKLRKEKQINNASIIKKKAEIAAIVNDPNNHVDRDIKKELKWHIDKNEKSPIKTTIEKLNARNIELSKKLSKDPNPQTATYAANIFLNGIILALIFLCLAIIYQIIMRFNSKYDADAFMNLRPIEYIQSIRDRYPEMGREQLYAFVDNYLEQYPMAAEIYRTRKKPQPKRREYKDLVGEDFS